MQPRLSRKYWRCRADLPFLKVLAVPVGVSIWNAWALLLCLQFIEVFIRRVPVVRIDNNEPDKIYKDFWDWLFNHGHVIFVLALAIGYLYYLSTTTEA